MVAGGGGGCMDETADSISCPTTIAGGNGGLFDALALHACGVTIVGGTTLSAGGNAVGKDGGSADSTRGAGGGGGYLGGSGGEATVGAGGSSYISAADSASFPSRSGDIVVSGNNPGSDGSVRVHFTYAPPTAQPSAAPTAETVVIPPDVVAMTVEVVW